MARMPRMKLVDGSRDRAPGRGAGRLGAAARGDRGAGGRRAARPVVRARRRTRRSEAVHARRTGDGLHVLRHSTAHVMAQAVCDLYPGAKYAIGPAIEDGFYYDFELPEPLVVRRPAGDRGADARADRRRRQPFVREEVARADALERLADQPYKSEIVEGLDEADARARSAAATPSRSTATASGPTCAWARTCRRPAGWAPSG